MGTKKPSKAETLRATAKKVVSKAHKTIERRAIARKNIKHNLNGPAKKGIIRSPKLRTEIHDGPKINMHPNAVAQRKRKMIDRGRRKQAAKVAKRK